MNKLNLRELMTISGGVDPTAGAVFGGNLSDIITSYSPGNIAGNQPAAGLLIASTAREVLGN